MVGTSVKNMKLREGVINESDGLSIAYLVVDFLEAALVHIKVVKGSQRRPWEAS